MAKTQPKAAAKSADPTAETAAEPVEKKTTDKTYKSLSPVAEIVVEVGPRIKMKGNKPVTVEAARNVVMTKAGYEAMDRNEEGETIHIATEVLGIPEYKTVQDFNTPDGTRKDIVVLYFADGAGPEKPEAEEEEGDEA
ncbi:hypothetical protein [Spirosoma oryzicola]|uniref:hypothetical protein n=1 Tax=Spirosoma oryzicola TaxID=2898794 RepID=UPI001E51BDC9|nr:hypothetical protein [Spirosoma oryzicola]UHG91768.1 hypothetical protein LQ777_02450 [Spirosoma oryzicola]